MTFLCSIPLWGLGQISQKERDGLAWIALWAGWEIASRGWTISWQDLTQILRMAIFGKPGFTLSMFIIIKLQFDITKKNPYFFQTSWNLKLFAKIIAKKKSGMLHFKKTVHLWCVWSWCRSCWLIMGWALLVFGTKFQRWISSITWKQILQLKVNKLQKI